MQECNKDDALFFDVALFHTKISKIFWQFIGFAGVGASRSLVRCGPTD
jgi:hypothetical protein